MTDPLDPHAPWRGPAPAGDPEAWTQHHGLPTGGALLAAGGPVTGQARYAALVLNPVEVLSWRLGDAGDPFEALAALGARGRPWPAGPAPRVVCLLGYDLGRAVEALPTVARVEGHLPDLWAARYRAAWIYDRATGEGWLAAEDAAAGAALEQQLAHPPAPEAPLVALGPALPELDAAAYEAALTRIQAHITAGDTYQINFALRFSAPVRPGNPAALFGRLHARSPVPFAACVRPSEATAVLCLSPERFLRWDATGRVETRPIKGTRPRGVTPEADASEAAALLASAKDAAEHVMIVDLERNDLGRVCAPGTVRVPHLRALESYATVHHLVSTVEGVLEPPHGLAALLRATFPGGSITGAPRRRAMEIIEHLEPVRRGPYCGALGYLDAHGGGDLNIAIRTAWVAGERIYYSAGGGIVADSQVAAEYAEALLKARAFREVISAGEA